MECVIYLFTFLLSFFFSSPKKKRRRVKQKETVVRQVPIETNSSLIEDEELALHLLSTS